MIRYLHLAIIISCILLFVGCREKEQCHIKLNISNSQVPVTYCCSTVKREYSHIQRIFDATGNGYTIKEKIYSAKGRLDLESSYNNDNFIELWLYVHSRAYPLGVQIAWQEKFGVEYSRYIELQNNDYPIETLSSENEGSHHHTYLYAIHMYSDGNIVIKKYRNFTQQGIKNSYKMEIQDI